MGTFFLKKSFTRVLGIILRYVCWGSHGPPPTPQGTRRLTGRSTSPPPPLPPPPFPSRPPKGFAHGWVSRFEQAAPLVFRGKSAVEFEWYVSMKMDCHESILSYCGHGFCHKFIALSLPLHCDFC